jgi:hypothetical protein
VNKDVLVAFKLLIFNVDCVDNEFKLLNIVVLVAFKLLIFNVDCVDNEFKLLLILVLAIVKSITSSLYNPVAKM